MPGQHLVYYIITEALWMLVRPKHFKTTIKLHLSKNQADYIRTQWLCMQFRANNLYLKTQHNVFVIIFMQFSYYIDDNVFSFLTCFILFTFFKVLLFSCVCMVIKHYTQTWRHIWYCTFDAQAFNYATVIYINQWKE